MSSMRVLLACVALVLGACATEPADECALLDERVEPTDVPACVVRVPDGRWTPELPAERIDSTHWRVLHVERLEGELGTIVRGNIATVPSCMFVACLR